MSEERKSRYELFLEADQEAPKTKRCSKCKVEKALGEFHKGKDCRFGVRSRCKKCSQRRKYKNREDQFWKMFWTKAERLGGCLEWNGSYTDTGQPCCAWKGKAKTLVRRLVYQLVFGPVPDDMFVLTTCDNTRCVSQFHMRQGTAADLEFKRVTHTATGDAHYSRQQPERLARGSRHANSKITEADAERIPAMRREMSVQSIADYFGVSIHLIYSVLNKKHWKHVDTPSLSPSEKPKFLPKGEQHGMAKLNTEKVREMRARFFQGESKSAIARSMGVSFHAAHLAICHKTWAHVE
jgi:hypothetical protein